MLLHQAQSEFHSIAAFSQLSQTLAAFNAPNSLVARALQAACEEARHTQLILELAWIFGAKKFEVSPTHLTTDQEIIAFAIHNFVEGCVRETFAATIALRQSHSSAHSAVASTFAEIARDEINHAVLAWDVAEYLSELLDDDALRTLRIAASDTVASLVVESSLFDQIPILDRSLLGLPNTSEARTIIRALEDCVWGPYLSDLLPVSSDHDRSIPLRAPVVTLNAD
ncbi:MAG: hypothetical protein JNK05_29235 [Myxococcales bacterium]|nr:hypothetical protein [Myxococcales bacterium]